MLEAIGWTIVGAMCLLGVGSAIIFVWAFVAYVRYDIKRRAREAVGGTDTMCWIELVGGELDGHRVAVPGPVGRHMSVPVGHGLLAVDRMVDDHQRTASTEDGVPQYTWSVVDASD